MTAKGTFPAELWNTAWQLYPLRWYFISPDYDRALELLGAHLELRIHAFSPEDVVNGWVLPPSWDYRCATISRNGQCLYDASENPLRIIALSTAFQGSVSREVLREHLHWDRRHEQWVPWHFRQLYRPWERTWGFCVPKTFYDALEPRDYDVSIRTEEFASPLKVADYTIPGLRPETVALVAHLDHPHMANDDLAGVLVGVRLMHLLAQQRRKFTCRLVIVQEITGSEYYLAKMAASGEKQNFIAAMFLEMLGSDTPLALQLSHHGNTPLDDAVRAALEASGQTYRVGPFRTIVGNDEINWASHGIPMSSISRFPYPEYHSDQDDLTVLSPDRLEESARLVLDAFDRFEQQQWYRKTFAGCVCVSHPDYDLYVDAGQPALGGASTDQVQALRRLMDGIPIELGSAKTARQLATQFGLAEATAEAYLRRWVEKGLLETY
jgi:aminopeptidase-like protein